MSDDTLAAPAWYGKLPSLGDFASRRWPPELLEPWDAWLAAGLADWREHDPADWLAHYLACPSWRFVLMPGALMPVAPLPGVLGGEAQAHAGVLMPSVDRVGRYFPFTLLQPLPAVPGTDAEWRDLLAWLHRLDDLAVDALQDDWPVERLEAELAAPGLGLPGSLANPTDAAPAASAGGPLTLSVGPDLAGWVASQAAQQAHRAWQGQTWWWCTGADGDTVLKIEQGLPRGRGFQALLCMPPCHDGAGQ